MCVCCVCYFIIGFARAYLFIVAGWANPVRWKPTGKPLWCYACDLLPLETLRNFVSLIAHNTRPKRKEKKTKILKRFIINSMAHCNWTTNPMNPEAKLRNVALNIGFGVIRQLLSSQSMRWWCCLQSMAGGNIIIYSKIPIFAEILDEAILLLLLCHHSH